MNISLLDALVHAPLCGTSKRWPRKLHAIGHGEITGAWPSGTVTALCGARRLRLATVDGAVVLWPPTSRLADFERCRECWVLDGRKRPRRARSLFRRAS